MIETINPYNYQKIAEYEFHSDRKVEGVLESGESAFREWRNTLFESRSDCLLKLASNLEYDKEKFALLMADEMGKPLTQGIAEIKKCAKACRYFAENGEDFLQNQSLQSDASKSYIRYEPLGVIFAIMPWNFPFWQVIRFAAPALMAGNSVVLKHAPNVTECAIEIEKLFKTSGFPDHLFQTLIISVDQAERVIEDKRIKAVTLTGSTAAGKAVSAKAGSVVKKVVLELGGSDPYIILPDADLELASKVCAKSRMLNSGQSCIAAKRFIIHTDMEDEFIKLFTKQLEDNYQMGNPTEKGINIGPLAREDLKNTLARQVEMSLQKGAKMNYQMQNGFKNGAFFPPTLLTNVHIGMPAYDEELFGPVASVITYKNENEVIEIANDTIYGLGAAIFSSSLEKAEQLSHQIDAGNCFVNSMVRSDPALPFGGIKDSGYGRELSFSGIREFTNAKTVYVA